MKSAVGVWLKVFSAIMCAIEIAIVFLLAIFLIVVEKNPIFESLLVSLGCIVVIAITNMIIYALGEIVESLQILKRCAARISDYMEKTTVVTEDTQFLCEQSIKIEQMITSLCKMQSSMQDQNM